MDAKKSSFCSSSSGFTDEKRTPCERHLESSEIFNDDASPTTSPIEEELRARSVAASPLPYVTDVSQPEILSVASSSAQSNAEEVTVEVIHKNDDDDLDKSIRLISDILELMERSATAEEVEAARDEWSSNLTGLELLFTIKSDAPTSVFCLGEFMLLQPQVGLAALVAIGVSNVCGVEMVNWNRKGCLFVLQEIEMVARDIITMRQKTELKDLKKEATDVVVEAASFCHSLLSSTILSRWFSKFRDYRRLRDFRDRLLNMKRKLQIEMKRQLIIELSTAIESHFPEYAVGPEKVDISANENEEKHPCIPAYIELEPKLKESLHDIHSFFDKWDWREVAKIVGNDELETLKAKELVIKDANIVRVHDAIKSNCRQDTDGTVLTSASQIQALLEKKETKDIQKITGIWLLHENKGSPSMTAAKLDLMCRSLRVLALGKFGKVEGKCREVFKKMVFFQAGIPQLPFNVGSIPELRYFSFTHEDFQLQKGYSNRYVRQNSKLQYPREWKIGNVLKDSELYSREQKCRCLDGLHYKRSLLKLVTLWDLKHPGVPHDRYGFFAALKDALFGLKKLTSLEDLPHHLGNLICLGREINLLKHHEQSSIYLESIARLMSILCSLEISSCSVSHDSQDLLREIPFLQLLARCSSLEKRLCRFGELKNLTVLNLQNCWLLKKLPEGLGKLECLVELDLSFCCSLEDFCPDFHFLRSLQILKLTYCESLKKLPEDFRLLVSLQLLDLSFCYSLEDFCTNFHLLPSLQILNLTSCESLKKLPQDFRLLVSLQLLILKFCKTLEGESMDKVTKCKKLETLFIEGSPMLEERWEAMKKKGKQPSSLVVYTKEEGTSDKDNRASQL